MLCLTRLNGSSIVLNADLIESIEANPDTVVVLVTQRKIVVRESPETIIDKVVAFRRRCQFAEVPVHTQTQAEMSGHAEISSSASLHTRAPIIALHETKRLTVDQKRSPIQDDSENTRGAAYRIHSLVDDEEERS